MMNWFEVHDTDFDMEEIDERITGAGILPIAVDEYNNIRFLLGKERFINQWIGSLKWSGFEGGRKMDETIEQTASREFIEESMGVVPLGESGDCKTQDQICSLLRDRKFCIKLVLCIKNGVSNERHCRRYHVTYLVQTPYSSEYSTKFDMKRLELLRHQEMLSSLRHIKQTLIERQFPVDNNKWNAYEIDEIVGIRNLSETDCELEFRGNQTLNKTIIDDSFIANLYFEWFEKKATVMKYFRTNPTTAHANEWSTLDLNDDLLEKMCIQWWSVEQLLHVLNNGGSYENEQFRAYFLPVLYRYLNEIRG